MRRLMGVVTSSLAYHMRCQRERYLLVASTTLSKRRRMLVARATRRLALQLNAEVVFLLDTLAPFLSSSSSTSAAAAEEEEGTAAARTAEGARKVVEAWLSEAGVSAAAAAVARKAAIREAAFRSALLTSCFSLHQ